ncbi:hypothetical protein [Burkholderia seminalis]|uniref:hypothetical protein n=1 Tax=Burkholderia seminalis TaxID=488731 RepID=UPI000AB581F1|nr:hypothetical protein [Burkholderia seminalis]MCA8038539.1 hypothetical protein [Burkholderia seminalis]
MLATVQNILTALGGVTAVLLLIAAACWKLIDSGLTTWLTKRVSRGLERDAERYKHELSRDMESYKNELARAQGVEKIRVEMRKAVAEKLFDRRLNAYHELYVAISEIPSYILAGAMQPVENRPLQGQAYGRVQEFVNTLTPHQLYLPNDFKQEYRALLLTLLDLFAGSRWNTRPELRHEDAVVAEINVMVGALSSKLDSYYKLLPDDLANAIANA